MAEFVMPDKGAVRWVPEMVSLLQRARHALHRAGSEREGLTEKLSTPETFYAVAGDIDDLLKECQ